MVLFYEFKGMAQAFANKAKQTLIGKATRTLGTDYEVRDLRPEDLGETVPVWDWAVTTTSVDVTLVNAATINNDRWVAIYGIRYPETTPLFSRVKITAGGGVKMDRNIQGIAESTNHIAFFDPVFIDQNQSVTIVAYNALTSTNAAENLAFEGLVVEKRGLVLTPTC